MDFIINSRDNVSIKLSTGQKYAICDILEGENVVKYGFSIGTALNDIKKGDWVHTHNLKTSLGDILNYKYSPSLTKPETHPPFMINAFTRQNGDIGIRNDIFIIPTVSCVNSLAKRLARETGALAFEHPYGCSQLGGDHNTTQLNLCATKEVISKPHR